MDPFLELLTKAKQTSDFLCDEARELLSKAGPVEEIVVREIHSDVCNTHNRLVQLLSAIKATRGSR